MNIDDKNLPKYKEKTDVSWNRTIHMRLHWDFSLGYWDMRVYIVSSLASQDGQFSPPEEEGNPGLDSDEQSQSRMPARGVCHMTNAPAPCTELCSILLGVMF